MENLSASVGEIFLHRKLFLTALQLGNLIQADVSANKIPVYEKNDRIKITGNNDGSRLCKDSYEVLLIIYCVCQYISLHSICICKLRSLHLQEQIPDQDPAQ